MADPISRVLIVEDESITALDLKSMLTKLGYDVVGVAKTGEDAIAKANATEPDVVLMDIRLQGEMDGIEAAASIQERHQIPVVYLTAYGDEDTLGRARGTRPFGYLLKPFGERELQIALEAALFRRELERKLIDNAAELARSNADLEQFAYVASHDLQEPLRMVASFVELLARRYRGKLDADADEFIGYAVEGVARMRALIEGLLAYSRVGTRGHDLQPTDCEPAFERAVFNLQTAVQEYHASITHDPLPTVRGDATQLTQLFQNVLGNALKFRGTDAPRIHVSAERQGAWWRLSCADNGIGIEPAYRERIFVIFQRLHGRDHYPGTGIGLAICKKIIERHGGRIWVESTAGAGSTFHFTLPAA